MEADKIFVSSITDPAEAFRVFSILNSQLSLEALLPRILDLAVSITGAERSFLMVRDGKGELSIKAARSNKQQDLEEEDFQGSTSIIKKVVETGEPLYVSELPAAGEFSTSESVRRWNLQSAVCIPLWRRAPASNPGPEMLGVLYLDSSLSGRPLEMQQLNITETLANHVGLSIANARLFEEVMEKNRQISKLNEQLQKKVEQQSSNLHEMKLLLAETQREVGTVYGLGNIIGRSKPMLRLFRMLEKVVETDATVLIIGESGTGKELFARYIHYNGARAEKPMVSINCSAFNETLLESELFGHVKGAFTGAHESKMGLFVLADGGTLFLDEVGDMSLEMQKKLLRALQEGEVRPVGGKEDVKVDVRIVAATNKNLKDLIRTGEFREELYYRLNVIMLEIPPLRERAEDIPLLVDYFSGKISDELKRSLQPLPEPVLREFLKSDWPGNVRELENELRRAFILGTDYVVRQDEPAVAAGVPEEMNLDEVEKRTVLRALESAHGNKSKAAQMLGISRRTFYKKLIRYNIY